MLVSFIIILVLLVLVIVFVTWPLFKDDQTTETGTAPTESYEEILLQIRDLDFDHQAGKVSEDDYPGLREALVVKAAGLLAANQAAASGELERE